MKQLSKNQKNQRLLKQYPFVSDVLSSQMEPFDGEGGSNVDHLTIRIEKADGDLMYRQADNVGLGEHTFMTQVNRKGQVMRRGEYIFAINNKGKIINRVDWPRNDHERHAIGGNIYGKDILWKANETTGDPKPICNEVECLVWATVEAWHKTTNTVGAFGELQDRSVNIIIYLKPNCGFKELSHQSYIQEHLCLDSKMLMQAFADSNRDIIMIIGRVYELCQLFQDEVYFGMKDMMDKDDNRGGSGQFGSVRVFCTEVYGYNGVMLEDAVSWISFQLRPEAKTMHILGIHGTLPQLRNLVKNMIKVWNEKPECHVNFVPFKDFLVLNL